MRKFFALSLLLLSLLSARADERPIGFNELPTTAQEFIKTHFPGVKMSYATKDAELTSTDYEVRLENGAKIEFNGKGEWTEVKNKASQVPTTIVPEGIAEYISQNFPGASIVKLEHNRFCYEVSLSNRMELKFDLNSKFLGIDD